MPSNISGATAENADKRQPSTLNRGRGKKIVAQSHGNVKPLKNKIKRGDGDNEPTGAL